MTTSVTNCLECGAVIPAEAKGLCPKCLLKLGLASQLGRTSLPASPANSGPPPIMPFEFGSYRIERLLGKGGMGAVYAAEDLASGRRVALKALGHSLDSPDTRKRFLREGRLAASINHPNTVYVYGTEEIEGAPVITMEIVDGGTLHDRVKQHGPMPVTEAVDAILQIIAGLEAAHAVGILHRDVKPSNCFIEPDGTVKVGDFGLSISTTMRGDSALTLAGSVLGTPEFSSPEQLRGEELNVRSDIYSVGMTLYFLLTGKTPFQADNVVQLLATVLDKAPPSPRLVRPEIPESLARIILRCLEKQAGDRFANYDELRRALLPFTSTAPTPATLGLRFVAGVVDHFAMTALNMSLSLALAGNMVAITDPKVLRSPQWMWICSGLILLDIVYFAVPEGLWGASLGKALLGLRVADLQRNAPGIPRALLRAVIYMLPTLLTFALYRGHADVQPFTASNITFSVIFFLYPALLCLAARRANGFALIHDLLTHTRVIQKSAYEPRAAVAQAEEPIAATDALPKIGPYHALANLSANGNGELILGYDTALLRRVWIRKVRAGEPSIPPELRNAARPGRLRWLQGRRTEAESWDAYEAVSGTPLVNLISAPQPWKSVRHWLHDLAANLEVASHDGSLPAQLALDRVWITSDGRAKLLDFCAPGANQAPEPIPGSQSNVFLNQLAISALEGRAVSADEARTREPRLPLPLGARDVLRELRATPLLAAIPARLKPLLDQVAHVTRRRRLGLVAGCVIPALVTGGFMFMGMRMFDAWRRQYPEVQPLTTALRIHDQMATGQFPINADRAAGSEAINLYRAEGAEALDLYIAGRFGNAIRDRAIWSSQYAQAIVPPKMRETRERILAAHPNPTPAEMEHARIVLAPVLDSHGELSPASHDPHPPFDDAFSIMLLAAPGGMLLWAAFFSAAAAVISRGGLLMRAFGIAVVRPDGSDASRLRMLWRACLAWLWMPIGLIAFSLLTPLTGFRIALGIVLPIILGLVAWSAALRDRSLQDRLAGTRLVPR